MVDASCGRNKHFRVLLYVGILLHDITCGDLLLDSTFTKEEFQGAVDNGDDRSGAMGGDRAIGDDAVLGLELFVVDSHHHLTGEDRDDFLVGCQAVTMSSGVNYNPYRLYEEKHLEEVANLSEDFMLPGRRICIYAANQ